MTKRNKIIWSRELTEQELKLLKLMADDEAQEKNTRRRAQTILAINATQDIALGSKRAGVPLQTAKKYVASFLEFGWQGLVTTPSPRGGDFLTRYDQGYWAERLVKDLLERDKQYRAIPYGTSRSEPFTDRLRFSQYHLNEFLLNAYSFQSGRRWKRPDLLTVPRRLLFEEQGNDMWTPDLIHMDNEQCRSYVETAGVAIEVETSLWQVKAAKVHLSFTIKQEDLSPLRNWIADNSVPLYVVQVFYDQAYALSFKHFEYLISEDAPAKRRITPNEDRITKKFTFMVPLHEGNLLGDIPEPEVEGRIFKDDNGKVTVYGSLIGSSIEPAATQIVQNLAKGNLLPPIL